jgi:tripartite-type tricarboxylate transporter receptor subunit TctC
MSTTPAGRRKFLRVVPAACAFAALPLQPAGAQTPAGRQIRLIVPFPPGGGTDQMARIIGAKLAEATGAAVVIDNRAGASGTIGIGFASKLPPDGLNLVIGQADNLAAAPLLIRNVPYDPVSDLQPIAHIADLPIVFLTATEQPYKTLADVIAAGKADENLLTFASPGVGTTAHLSGEVLAQAAGFKMRHIAYKGAAPSLTDVMASRVTLMSSSIASAMPYIKSGKLRPLAVTSSKRSAALPDVPAVAEAANLPGFDVGTWYGIFAPVGVGRETAAALNRDVNKVLALPDVKAHIEGQEGGAIRQAPPEALTDLLRADIAKWDRVIKEAKISLE